MAKVRKVRKVGKVSKVTKTKPEPAEAPAEEPAPSPPVDWAAAAEAASEEYASSPEIGELAASFVAFRAACPNPAKDKKGYNYRYVTLANIIVNTQELLNEHGLAVMQFPVCGPNSIGCITILVHASGQFIRSRFTMPIPSMVGVNLTQEAGAAITYARRYALGAVLCLAADEDTDATYDD